MNINTITFSECSKSYTDKELSQELAQLAGADNVSGRVELIDKSILLGPRQAKANAVKVFESFGFPCPDIGRNTRLVPSHQLEDFEREMETAMRLYSDAGDDFRRSWQYNSDVMVDRFHHDVKPRVRQALNDRAPKPKDFKANLTSICIGDMPQMRRELSQAQNEARLKGYEKGLKDMAIRVQDAIMQPVNDLLDRLVNSGGGTKDKRVTETACREALKAFGSIGPVLLEFGDNLDLKQQLFDLSAMAERYGNLQPSDIITSTTVKAQLKDDLSSILGFEEEEVTEEQVVEDEPEQEEEEEEECFTFKTTPKVETIDWDAVEETQPTTTNTLEEDEIQW